MKIVICPSNHNLVSGLLTRPLASSHTASLEPKALHACVAEMEPHLVLLGGDDLAVQPKALEKALRELGFHTRILVIPNECEDSLYPQCKLPRRPRRLGCCNCPPSTIEEGRRSTMNVRS